MDLSAWFQELRRRRVIRALLGWGLFSFAVLQVVDPLLRALRLPEWSLQVVVFVLAAGFPATAGLAWAFDLTRRGIERTGPAGGSTPATAARWAGARPAVTLVLVGALIGAGVAWLALRQAGPAAPALTPSIAVLPFADMSPGKDQEYFADGVAEEILNALARVKGLKVIGRASSFAFRGKPDDLRTIGQNLGVANVLEGSIRKEGSQIRVAVKLVRVVDGSQAWSEIYDRKLAGIFKVQEEIARAVAGNLAPLLDGAAGTQPGRAPATTPEAYAQFLLGRQLQERSSEEEVQRSLEAFERAVALDPAYAPAWAGMALSCYMRSQGLGPDMGKMREKGRAAAERAVALGPDLSLGYEARVSFRLADWDWEGARADAERAVVLDPGSAVARRRRALVQRIVSGDPTRGLQDLELAMALDPLATSGWHQMGLRRRLLREPQKARDALRRALEIDPGYGPAIVELAILELQAGRVAEARHLVAKRSQTPVVPKFWPAIFAYAEGNHEVSRAAVADVTQAFAATDPTLVARLHAWRGEVDQAFQWLDLAVSRRDPWLRYARDSFWLERLHSDPRWKEMLKKMNLPVD